MASGVTYPGCVRKSKRPVEATNTGKVGNQWNLRPREPRKCHYCGKIGHIKDNCWALHGGPNTTRPEQPYRRFYEGVPEESLKDAERFSVTLSLNGHSS